MRCVPVVLLALAACGGQQIPQHSGYKSDKATPWKKAKALTLDEKGEGKASDDLSYPAMKRARWYAVTLPAPGELAVRLEVTPPGDNDDFDLAMEVLDPSNRVLAKADAEEEDAHEIQKSRTLKDLPAGRYLVHLYLGGRLDTADFTVRVAYKPSGPADLKTDFPAQVAFLPALPTVPVADDTPPSKYPKVDKPQPPRRGHGDPAPRPEKPADKPPEKAAAAMSARVIGVTVAGGGAQVTLNVGTNAGAKEGMKLTLKGVADVFQVGSCKPSTCSAVLAGVTPDMIARAGGTVSLAP